MPYSPQDIDIAHNRVGKADIAFEYTSDANPRFILHDSQGFEPGSEEKWEVVEKFIRDKCDERLESKERLHAIWWYIVITMPYWQLIWAFIHRLCIETPRTGLRLRQTADERLLELASECEPNLNTSICSNWRMPK